MRTAKIFMMIITMLLSWTLLLTDATAADLPDSYKGIPLSAGVVTISGGIGSSWTYISIYIKKENSAGNELVPVNIKTNDPDIAARIMALINGAIKMETPLRLFTEKNEDGDLRVRAVEAEGITINIL